MTLFYMFSDLGWLALIFIALPAAIKISREEYANKLQRDFPEYNSSHEIGEGRI